MSEQLLLVDAVQLSKEQEPAVLALERDVVVTAGAGAGKTRTLVGRYLALLEKGVAPRRIAAITFTRKAAREMRNRVRDEIDRFTKSLGPGSPQAQHWEDIQRQLDAARIGTIHELCAQILRTHPAEAGIDPRFRMLEEGSMAWLQGEAVTDSLAWAVDQAHLAPLFSEAGAARLRDIVAEMLRKGTQPFPERMAAAGWLARWETRLAAEQAEAVRAYLEDGTLADAAAELASCLPLDRYDRLALQRAAALEAFAAARAGDWGALACLAEISLVGGSQKAWRGGKEEKQLVAGCLKTVREQWKAGPGRIPAGCHDGDRILSELQAPLAELFTQAAGLYRKRKDEREALDFEDLERMALVLLHEKAHVREFWQRQLDALLVDEYQDTNEQQRQIINLLSGGRGNLFIVGDGKQSIYRFRGAEVAVFRDEQNRIVGRGGLAHELSTSYRPHAALLQALNTLLSEVMESASSASQPWRVPFAPLRHYRETPTYGLSGPFVALDLAVGNKEEALPRAASACAARIEALKAEHETLRYEDVAILCRSSASFAYYEDALEERGIPYQTIAGRGFYERPEIRDLLNALQAILEPADDLALFGFLRSPVAGFDDGALYRLRKRQLDAKIDSLWAAIQEEQSDDAKRAVALLVTLHRAAGRSDAAAILQQLLEETDYVAALQQAGEGRAARNVAKLLADAQQSGLVHLHDFLTYVRDVQQQVRASEARATVADAVQIMSIHQAKGLEFPVVVIGDVNHQSGRGAGPMIIDPELGVLFEPNSVDDEPAVLRLAKLREKAQEEAESDRIFYVAATRARDMLLLNGNVALSNGRPRGSGWLKQLLPPLGLDEQVHWTPETGSLYRPEARLPAVACTLYGETYRPPEPAPPQPEPEPLLPDAWQPALARPVPRVGVGEEREGIPFWRVVPAVERLVAPAWLIGTLVHEALAAWRFPQQPADAGFDRWARARTRSLGIGDEERLAGAARQVSDLLLRFRRHPLYRKIDKARRLSEVPFAYEEGHELRTGTIDLLYEDGDGWYLIDFKSDRVADVASCAERPIYEAQVRRYAAAVQRLAGITPRCSLCWLNVRGAIVEQPVPFLIEAL